MAAGRGPKRALSLGLVRARSAEDGSQEEQRLDEECEQLSKEHGYESAQPPTRGTKTELPSLRALHKVPSTRALAGSPAAALAHSFRRREGSLPTLSHSGDPKTPTGAPPVGRVLKEAKTGSFRVGNVVRVRRAFATEQLQLKGGDRGHIEEVALDGSIKIRLQDDIAKLPVCSTVFAWIPRRAAANLELLAATHEVALIDACGQPANKFLLCIVLKEHTEQKEVFADILCQDGRQVSWVHRNFLQPLPADQVTDLGFLASAVPGPSVLKRCETSPGDVWAQAMLRMGQLMQDQHRDRTCELPPSGFEKPKPLQSLSFAAAGAALRAARSAQSLEALETPQTDAVGEAVVQEQKSTSSICPFMEIGDTGLRGLVEECKLTSRDVVFDLGCGQGKIIGKLLETYPCRGVGVEVNPQLGRVAEHRLQKFGKRSQVVIDDACNVDFSEGTALVAFFLSHSYDAAGASLKEHLSKCLQPGTVVYNVCYPINGWHGTYRNGVHKYVIGQHLDPER
eukprot:TRINITY_DN24147_c0_g1_i1.p1 TRINITY_DN24147_c0_g1~~TRINITY_DN24147_c0_g1_i1.p1  ORF type:complete len:510 (-),score=76.41 TRINITY_DN24147_c0_g1_i1:15-1544(-)